MKILGKSLYGMVQMKVSDVIFISGPISHIPFLMYADDTQLEPESIDILVDDLELSLNDIRNWMLFNKLKLNEEKTEIILCNPKNFDIPISSLKFGDEIINFSKTGKNLGVVFDEKLNLNNHIASVSKIVYTEIRRLKQITNFISSKSGLQKLASLFVLSRLVHLCFNTFFEWSTWCHGCHKK